MKSARAATGTSCAVRIMLCAAVLTLVSSKVVHERGEDGQCDSDQNTCTVQDKETLVIPCGSHSSSEAGVFFSYQLLNGTILEHETSEFLRINASREIHNGLFVCCNANDSIHSTCYRINVTYAPAKVPLKWPEGYSFTPIYKQEYKLLCPLEGNPPASYWWERYTVDLSEKLDVPDDLEFEENGRMLDIPLLREEHNGLYVCYANNSLGSAVYQSVTNFWVHVSECEYVGSIQPEMVHIEIGPSEGTSQFTNFHYPEGSTIRINCSMSPAPYHIPPYWYQSVNCSSGRMTTLEGNSKYSVERRYEGCAWSSELTIANFTKSMAGTYFCGNCQYHFENQTLRVAVEDPEVSSTWHPNSPTQLTVVVTIICVVLVVAASLLVCVGVFMSRKCLSVPYTATEEPPAQGFSYDVFISAHDETRSVAQDILHSLENECEPPYKVCWHHRDFIAGLPITEQIAEAVQTSRKVVFLFSEHFSESKFCCLELEHALHRLMMTRTRCLVPITLSEGAVPRSLRRRITYWPVVNAQEEGFIQRLTKLIGQPICEVAEEVEVGDNAPLIK